MLTPFDGVQVNSFLDQLPERAELSQEGDALADSFQNVVDFTSRGETANAKTDTAVRTFVTVSQSAEDIARL